MAVRAFVAVVAVTAEAAVTVGACAATTTHQLIIAFVDVAQTVVASVAERAQTMRTMASVHTLCIATH